MALASPAETQRRTFTAPKDLFAEARRFDVNVSQAAREGLAAAVKAAKAQWLATQATNNIGRYDDLSDVAAGIRELREDR
jgi:post-segregation antitoxin (ccd killing protein)